MMEDSGVGPELADPVTLIGAVPAVDDEQRLENMRSSISRNLPRKAGRFRPHDHVLSIAAGGPSLADTYQEMTGYVGAVNASLTWLLEHDVVPNACGVLDPGPHMKDIVEPHPDVHYFVASICHPSVFDKLSDCKVILWHPSGIMGVDKVFADEYPDKDWLMIGGGSTMGLRWLNLGYVMGFRTFGLHGMDSSFRNGDTHAYPDRRDTMPDRLTIEGYETRSNFAAQAVDFIFQLERFQRPDIEPTKIDVFGDGLLPHYWRKYLENHPGVFGTC